MGLDGIRQEINKIDEEMKELFLKRMELSYQVIEEKKQTGAPVYAPRREQEILFLRSENVNEEYVRECQAFFRQMMGISRTYQYSKIINQKGIQKDLPNGSGKVFMKFKMDSGRLAACLDAVLLAGLRMSEITAEEKEKETVCSICLSGDFSHNLSKAAVLQILEENQDAVILKIENIDNRNHL